MSVDSLHDRDTERKVCPECESVAIESKAPSHSGQDRIHAEDYYCKECQTHFDEPDTDTGRRRQDPTFGPAARLAKLGKAMDEDSDVTVADLKEGGA